MISEEKAVFTYVNWKSLHIIIPFAVLISIGALSLWIGLTASSKVFAYFGAVFLTLLLGIFLVLHSIKIKVGKEGLEYSSISKSVFMSWNDVRTVGGYIATRYTGNLEMDLNDINKGSFWGQRFLFVSAEESNQLKVGQKITERFIYFHFRLRLLELIVHHLKINSNSLPFNKEKVTKV